jgi:hypothetical protein
VSADRSGPLFGVFEQGIRIEANLFVSINQFVNYLDFVNSGRDFVSGESPGRQNLRILRRVVLAWDDLPDEL